ncbi:MAG: YtxH domain-containing protein [Chromatiaceae bacterium]|nr:MAG: YtxH domain-containing protein [Chromatiaceae bacterium]
MGKKSKKKEAKRRREAMYAGYGWGPHDHDGHGYGPGYGAYGEGPWGYEGANDPRGAQGRYGYGYGGEGAREGEGLFDGLKGLLRGRHNDQFLLGLAIGAGAAWVLSDEEMRRKLMKAGVDLYSGVAGGVEELKEQMADIKAEMDAERHGDK